MNHEEEREYIWEHKGQLVHLYGRDIYYIHLQERIVYAHTRHQTYAISMSMNELEEQLKGQLFIRTHYSYLVHIRHLVVLRCGEILLRNGESVPVSKSRRQQVVERVNGYFRQLENCLKLG
ncbi:MAG: LytTR family DNA-binding domain-containing protein [Lachnospiraceae bacterium]|nr:LytTR family DNA-binding domain-containing protein [Lachnospiraceae bacterium]